MSNIEKLDLASENQRLRELVAELEEHVRKGDEFIGAVERAEKAERELDEVWQRFSIESDESLLECVERTVNGWKLRAERAELRVVEQAREWEEVNDALAKELDRTAKVEHERDEANNEINRWSSVTRELRQKLAIAGVEGSPPPDGETTIGALFERAEKAERERDEARAQAAVLREALADMEDACAQVASWSVESIEYSDAVRVAARAALAASPGDWLAARDRALAKEWQEATGYDDPERLDFALGRAGVDAHIGLLTARLGVVTDALRAAREKMRHGFGLQGPTVDAMDAALTGDHASSWLAARDRALAAGAWSLGYHCAANPDASYDAKTQRDIDLDALVGGKS